MSHFKRVLYHLKMKVTLERAFIVRSKWIKNRDRISNSSTWSEGQCEQKPTCPKSGTNAENDHYSALRPSNVIEIVTQIAGTTGILWGRWLHTIVCFELINNCFKAPNTSGPVRRGYSFSIIFHKLSVHALKKLVRYSLIRNLDCNDILTGSSS